jgi:hypothetical protein
MRAVSLHVLTHQIVNLLLIGAEQCAALIVGVLHRFLAILEQVVAGGSEIRVDLLKGHPLLGGQQIQDGLIAILLHGVPALKVFIKGLAGHCPDGVHLLPLVLRQFQLIDQPRSLPLRLGRRLGMGWQAVRQSAHHHTRPQDQEDG